MGNTEKKEGRRGRKRIEYKEIVTPEILEIIKMSVADGAIDKDVIKFLGISKSTFYKFKAEHKEFSDALKASKEIADRIIESALFKSAKGYKRINKKKIYNEFGEVVQVIEDVEEVKPNVTAIIYWLNNRKPDEWRNRRNENLNDDNEELGIIEISEIKEREESEYQDGISAGGGTQDND